MLIVPKLKGRRLLPANPRAVLQHWAEAAGSKTRGPATATRNPKRHKGGELRSCLSMRLLTSAHMSAIERVKVKRSGENLQTLLEFCHLGCLAQVGLVPRGVILLKGEEAARQWALCPQRFGKHLCIHSPHRIGILSTLHLVPDGPMSLQP